METGKTAQIVSHMTEKIRPINRREIIREYFRYADAGDVRALELFTDDVKLTYPKFGTAIGKEGVGKFFAHMATVFRKLQHDIEGLSFIEAGDVIAVEGREWGEMADGTPFPDGELSHGLFCVVYEFRGDRIRALRVYTDPDFTSSDKIMIKALRPAAR